LYDSLDDFTWLYRGVPEESSEVEDVAANGEVYPPRPDRIGERARREHISDEMTDSGYTSWTTDRGIAEDAALFCIRAEGLIGVVVIFRVRIRSLEQERVFPGRDDEYEYLIEGTVENVEFSEDASDEEEND
jgi:hypothetical protein